MVVNSHMITAHRDGQCIISAQQVSGVFDQVDLRREPDLHPRYVKACECGDNGYDTSDDTDDAPNYNHWNGFTFIMMNISVIPRITPMMFNSEFKPLGNIGECVDKEECRECIPHD